MQLRMLEHAALQVQNTGGDCAILAPNLDSLHAVNELQSAA